MTKRREEPHTKPWRLVVLVRAKTRCCCGTWLRPAQLCSGAWFRNLSRGSDLQVILITDQVHFPNSNLARLSTWDEAYVNNLPQQLHKLLHQYLHNAFIQVKRTWTTNGSYQCSFFITRDCKTVNWFTFLLQTSALGWVLTSCPCQTLNLVLQLPLCSSHSCSMRGQALSWTVCRKAWRSP